MTRRDLLWLGFACVLFGGLDLLAYGTGPAPALLLQLSVDVSLLLLARFPVQVATWALAVAVLMFVFEHPVVHAGLPYATPAIVVNLIRLTDRRKAFLLVGLLAVVGTRFWAPSWDITPLALVNTVLPAVVVLYLRARGDLVDSLRERADRAADQARAAERRRLAEEMHDVVTHRITLMVLQAGALGATVADPATRDAAEEIRHAGAKALDELRELVGVLRDTDDTPAQGLVEPAALDPATLVADAHAVGEAVTFVTDGDPDLVSATVRRTAFRVVQESLTNARKHAPGAEVTVTLTYRPDGVSVRIVNGPADRPPDGTFTGSGVGLLGLAQRVELVGGTLRTGATPGGGYQVGAILPAYVPTRGEA
jgi:signal transduction histidine kinase